MKSIIFIAIFLSFPFFSFTQIDLSSEPIDSVISWMGVNFRESVENFHPVAIQALSRSYAKGHAKTLADVHAKIASWHGWNGYFPNDSIVYHSEKAVFFYEKAGEQKLLAKSLKTLSIDYINTGDVDKSLSLLLRALGIYESLEDEQGIAESYRSLSVLHCQSEEWNKSIEYADKAIALFEKVDNHASIAVTHFNLIMSYRGLKKYKKALEAANTCIEVATQKAPEKVFVPIRGYAHRYDIYIDMEEYELALADAKKSWQMAVDQVGEERANTYRLEIGNALRMLGRYEEAIPHMQAGIDAYERKGSINIWEPYDNISDCYQKLGDNIKALEYQKKATKLKYAMLESKIENLKTEAIVKYETGKKDQALAAQEVQLKQKSNIQTLILGIVGLLATLLFVLFYNFRKNKHTTNLLEIKNKENELLLREIHHRVKNNLQTISSLLSLQSESISDRSALDAVQESKNRVASMALLHQKLYQGKNLAAIEMGDYFNTIGKTIIESFGKKAEHVSLKVDMEKLELDVDTAVPIGLITNELITNSLKYAFPEKQKGEIKITLSKSESNLLTLQIADNGQPTPNDGVASSGGGFGTMLVQLLTTQLGGQLKKNTKAGTSTIINFKQMEKSAA